MKRYKDWAPTRHDTTGLGVQELQDWYVAPVIKTRDSQALDRSNFDSLEKNLIEGEYEKHGFKHWACGWFEILLIKPGTISYDTALDAETYLKEMHPVLDEDLMTEYEMEDGTYDE